MEARLNQWLSYSTVKLIDIHNYKLGLFHYSIQLIILAYILLYVVWWDSGYQGYSQVVGQVSVKPKGSALSPSPYSSMSSLSSRTGNRRLVNADAPLVWDATDLVIPFVESNAIFITTNSLVTPLQTRGNWSDPVCVRHLTHTHTHTHTHNI
jgi:hypothetical protein